MKTLECECTYCGLTWKDEFSTKQEVEDSECPGCGDTSLKIREVTKNNCYGYEE